MVTPEAFGAAACIQTIVVQDGKILAGGQASNGSNYNFTLARYDTYGNLDPTFGTGGITKTHFGTGDDIATGLALQARSWLRLFIFKKSQKRVVGAATG